MENRPIDPTQAFIAILQDLYKQERKRAQKNFIIALIISVFLVLSIVLNVLLIAELSSYDTVTITETTTTETYDSDIEGDNANIVNGNQYNDNAVHNQGKYPNNQEEVDE